ncbi:hypothetical protein DFA_10297 [Cavenderia fasciculata]|uniref:Uncharacterized protein n=1 Tax=Cavenderia fasciculata TaxID=261658 RepID=F4Q9T9_CACFS|nr:uncharacterized protein DFA_10297 [Cavenderia fasciculata]EGG15458.1 hypothetical protein DFA_10297 [Cavenderia fasciculata]|eukprot:XP_004354200.1 hypothetical protein DFA_10297 [Cavenderia fasciculata]
MSKATFTIVAAGGTSIVEGMGSFQTSGPDVWNSKFKSPSSTLVYDGKTYKLPSSEISITRDKDDEGEYLSIRQFMDHPVMDLPRR